MSRTGGKSILHSPTSAPSPILVIPLFIFWATESLQKSKAWLLCHPVLTAQSQDKSTTHASPAQHEQVGCGQTRLHAGARGLSKRSRRAQHCLPRARGTASQLGLGVQSKELKTHFPQSSSLQAKLMENASRARSPLWQCRRDPL